MILTHILLASIVLLGLLPPKALASDVILDSGHSPESSGAVGCSGRKEHDYNTALTAAVKLHLEKNGESVALTTNQSGSTSLSTRSKLAWGHKVLLSIHHDSVQPQFVKNNYKTSGVCSDKASGFSIFVSKKNPDYESSLLYARRLGESLVQRGLKPTLHHAEHIKGESRTLLFPELGIYLFDDLRVLKDTKIPAVLLEAAVIVNSVDEDLASSSEFKMKVSGAVLEMISSTYE